MDMSVLYSAEDGLDWGTLMQVVFPEEVTQCCVILHETRGNKILFNLG